MMETVTKEGQLKAQYKPAVYLDSSVVIDYWMTEGLELPETSEQSGFPEMIYGSLAKVVRDILRVDKRVQKVVELRKKFMYEDIKVVPVTTALALWELQEWNAEANLKQIASEIIGAIFIQRKSKKEVGRYLKLGYEQWIAEGEEKHHDPQKGTSGLELLMQSTWVNLSFAHSHGLNGILLAEIRNFSWPPTNSSNREEENFIDPLMLAYLQIGVADIMHVLVASHLGCDYFAGFDSDFTRAKPVIEESGMKLLSSPEEILAIL